MDLIELKLLETSIVLVLFLASRAIIGKLIDRTVSTNLLQKTRGKIIKKIIRVGLAAMAIILILTVWGVDQSELFVFMASVLTVIGIALFAQWSHLSNLTSGIIIFFNHSVKIDDTIAILDKEFEVEGRIKDIGFFFVQLKTLDGEEVTMPNNIFLQKMIKKKKK